MVVVVELAEIDSDEGLVGVDGCSCQTQPTQGIEDMMLGQVVSRRLLTVPKASNIGESASRQARQKRGEYAAHP